MFRISCKIIVFFFSKLSGSRACGPRAYPSLARRYWPETCRPGQAWAKHSLSGSGLGLNSSLRAWAGPEKCVCVYIYTHMYIYIYMYIYITLYRITCTVHKIPHYLYIYNDESYMNFHGFQLTFFINIGACFLFQLHIYKYTNFMYR